MVGTPEELKTQRKYKLKKKGRNRDITGKYVGPSHPGSGRTKKSLRILNCPHSNCESDIILLCLTKKSKLRKQNKKKILAGNIFESPGRSKCKNYL